mmetsp:Transcript_79382/g.140078  ORF Transcript_79382/g.140078 Transcript_79382/m.140078 type:complete len:382 (-) Transcript_79382:231-1376(-)
MSVPMIITDLDGRRHVVPLCPALGVSEARATIAKAIGVPSSLIRLVSSGKEWIDGAPLAQCGVERDTPVQVLLRLRGGGGDGGCHMVRRDCLSWVKGPSGPTHKYDRVMLGKMLWAQCKKSFQPLRPPIVSDELGLLYNKDVMLMALLDRENPENEDIRHIKKLSDLTQLQLQRNPAWREASEGTRAVDDLIDQYCCPVVNSKTTNGVTRFVFYKQCGHVVSDEAVKQLGTKECLVCHKPACTTADYDGSCENIITPLAPVDAEEQEALKEFAQKRRQMRSKESKKKRKGAVEDAPTPESAAAEDPQKRAPKNGEPPAKKAKAAYIVGAPKSLPLPSHNAPPPGATPEVWKSLFKDSKDQKPDTSFLTRAGMCGGGGGRNI